jgi:hypothetical protein
MSFRAITKQSETGRAYRAFKSVLTARTVRYNGRYIGWQRGRVRSTVYWNSTYHYWAAFLETRARNRYVCFFGIRDPKNRPSLGITCEVNPPKRGTDHRCAGVFVLDSRGKTHIAHTGKIGGSRKGVGKTAFVNFIGHDAMETVLWENGRSTDAVVIGDLGRTLPRSLGSFVRTVRAFKDAVRASPRSTKAGNSSEFSEFSFRAEFAGYRKKYAVGSVRAWVEHGEVVDGLERELRKRGFDPVNDRRRDLLIASKRRKITTLFEVKTSLATFNIYGAIGQLLFHGSGEARVPKLIMVVPEFPSRRHMRVLERIGIHVVRYSPIKGAYRFDGLDAALN